MQNHLSKPTLLILQNVTPLSGNQRPDLPTSVMNMSFVLRLPRKMRLLPRKMRLCRSFEMSHACHLLSKCCKTLMFYSLLTRSTISCACDAKPHLSLQKWSEPLVFLTFWLPNVLRATTACTFSTSELPKVVRDRGVLNILTSTCASRHNGVHFFDIWTSKSGPTLRCFVHFDFEMCFAPQRCALFRHLNFQKWSDTEVFCTFWLRNVLRATNVYTFSTSELPKVVRHWGVLNISLRNVFRATTACNFSSNIWPAGSAPAALASLLCDPPEPQILFLLTLSLLLFFLLIFLFSLLFICPYCRKVDL